MSETAELENRMEHMEAMLTEINKKLKRIEVGLFGDEEMFYTGLLERVKKLEDGLAEVRKVNDAQELSIEAKNQFTDQIVIWSRRAFWIIAVVGALIFILTGKVGIVDIIKMIR